MESWGVKQQVIMQNHQLRSWHEFNPNLWLFMIGIFAWLKMQDFILRWVTWHYIDTNSSGLRFRNEMSYALLIFL